MHTHRLLGGQLGAQAVEVAGGAVGRGARHERVSMRQCGLQGICLGGKRCPCRLQRPKRRARLLPTRAGQPVPYRA
jgi:hypothetical protein